MKYKHPSQNIKYKQKIENNPNKKLYRSFKKVALIYAKCMKLLCTLLFLLDYFIVNFIMNVL